MPAAPRQLALALDHVENLTRDDFLVGPPNDSALAMIERWPDWPSRVIALVGPAGSGKSHLASIWAEQSGARFLSARALPETHLPTALATGALVLEDIDDNDLDERAMFHLLNLVRQDQAWLLLTARTPPTQWRIALADLASRLRAVPALTLSPPDDALLRAVIVKLFADRQLAVDENLVGYLVSRIERSFAAARAMVTLLDQEALVRKRPVNRALATEVLRDTGF
ncbi:MAG: chromosomal replication initiator DnaA [Pseudorhodoplanes sp.]|jgi:chromosomal replication initiation ATPase DnaA|nr:chromosomal replication initiator DnaA [Pseudorhodoplanes sp.]